MVVGTLRVPSLAHNSRYAPRAPKVVGTLRVPSLDSGYPEPGHIIGFRSRSAYRGLDGVYGIRSMPNTFSMQTVTAYGVCLILLIS